MNWVKMSQRHMDHIFLIVCPHLKNEAGGKNLAKYFWGNLLHILYLKRGEDELQTAVTARDIEFDNF